MKKAEKKGATLAELTIVLGLIVIMSAMVVSFSMSLSRQTRLTNERVQVLGDVELVEVIAENWMGQIKLLGQTPSLEGETIKAGEYTLSFAESKFEGTLPGQQSLEYTCTGINSVAFSRVEDLFFCTVTYSLPGMGEKTQVFCINPRIGDTYGGGGQG